MYAQFQYGELFDKIDVTREGVVDWDKFASHMLLEFYEKDDRVKSTQVPQLFVCMPSFSMASYLCVYSISVWRVI